jgi:hypothetical protein
VKKKKEWQKQNKKNVNEEEEKNQIHTVPKR